ncbi:sigma-70 family RNA polymerase sigma factor [Maricaulis parjimensis]|uniref:sigma-70 family RNA polymerase sigma factor n=1 Tax=Maricaulis parjimensis TaxID=144023 RepID=UPI0019398E97|nr:sigma-70 family RNA polymerase sigma factor [Maricaulis parjimensis]
MTQDSERARPASQARAFAALMQRVGQERDRTAFGQLFEHFAPRIRTFLLNRRVVPAQADDLTQEVMLAVWRRASSYDASKAAVTTWIYTIARNLHIDHFRKTVRAGKMDEQDPILQPEPAPEADDLLSRSEDVDQVSRALADLPDDQKTVLELAFVEGLSHSEIATRLDLPLGTVKSRVRLAMSKLRLSLGDET